MTWDISVREVDTETDRETILASLKEYNHCRAGPSRAMPLALGIHDQHGALVGSLHAISAYDWLIVELVFVPEHLRGQGVGSALLARAEDVARDRNCRGIWLDTFSFQARGFYERIGYRLFGTIEGHPAGGARYFLKKALV